MKQVRFVVMLSIALILSANSVWARTLPSSEDKLIKKQLKDAGASSSSIELNVTIPVGLIPECPGHTPVNLTGTLIRPQRENIKLPTIVISTAYRREFCIFMGIGLVKHGYNLLAVDNRGTGSAGSDWTAFGLPEQYDIKYVVDEWIPSQSWSDGKVGMIGASYMAIIELMAAGLCDVDEKTGEPVHLKAIFPFVPMSDPYRTIALHGGNFEEEFMLFWLMLTDLLSIMPPIVSMQDGGIADGINTMIDTWMTHFKHIGTTVDWVTDPANAYYNDFYKVKSAQLYWPVKPATGWWYDKNEKGEILEIKEGRRSIPPKLAIFITDGWYNIFTMSALDTYQYGLFKHEPGNKALVMGPWYHLSGAAGLGVDGFLPTTADIAARWFDWKIKGEKDSFMTQYPVLLYVMGVDRWRAEKDWPINDERAVSSSLFLSRQKPSVISGDKFSTKNAGNNFSLKESASAWDYKGESPVMVHNPLDLKGVKSRSFNRWIAGIFSVMAEMDKAKSGKDDSGKWWEDERDDEQGMLTFTTEPLDRDIEITGGLSLEFWAKSKFPENLTQQAVVKITDKIREIYDIKNGNLILDNMNKKDVQWVVEINDVFEDGRAKNITSGWLSAWRRPFDPENVQNADPAYVPLDPFYIVNRTNLGLPQEDKIVEDKLYCYVVEIWPTCNVFKKGHRIRLSISGSDFPHMLPVMIPSESTIVIDNDHQARLDFTTIVNSDKSPEGGNWKWLRYRNSAKFNKYLAAVSNEFDAANSYLLGLGEDEQKLEPGPGPGPQPVPDPNPEPVTPEDSADSDSDSSFCFVRMAKL